jgi:hypothetical protein
MGVHPELSFRPEFHNQINAQIQATILNNEQNVELTRICQDHEKILPTIFITPRTQYFGNGSQ